MSNHEPTAQPPDGDLLDAWIRGNLLAGEELVARYFERVRGYFLRRTNRGDYEDQVQQTFATLHEIKSKYRGEGSVKAFILGIARNTLLHYLRDQQHSKFDPFHTSVRAALGAGPSSVMAQHEHHNTLLEALLKIPSADQDLLELHYWQELSGPELARLFEIPRGTVHSRLNRARERLRDAFFELSGETQRPTDQDLVSWLEETGRL